MKARRFSRSAWLALGLGLLALGGIGIRLDLAVREANFDTESYWLVSELKSQGRNVYQHTWRYNYGPGWMEVLSLMRKAGADSAEALRMSVALLLAGVDSVLGLLVAAASGSSIGAIFLLQPLSWVLSGTHSQFDNLALLWLLAALALLPKEGTAPGWPRLLAIAFLLGVSLVFKHLALILPVVFLFQNWSWPKRLALFLAPGILFYLSFAPYSLIWPRLEPHVFQYQASFSYSWWDHPPSFLRAFWARGDGSKHIFWFKLVFILMLAGTLWRFRQRPWLEQGALYLLAAFALQPGCAIQYLAILTLALVLRPTRLGVLLLVAGTQHLAANYGCLSFPYWPCMDDLDLYKIQLGAVLALAGAHWPRPHALGRVGSVWTWLHEPMPQSHFLTCCIGLSLLAAAGSGSWHALWLILGLGCLWRARSA